MSSQIAISPFLIKKVWKFLNNWMAIQLYTSHPAIHTQTQTESEAFKTHIESMTREAFVTKI